ncbi:hypothetical protein P43SY_006321 [Pythium insidiosum]|uniref:HIT-type domain-containing protein n=1 Tax=Pythium insidiosum TaxID=114742 RepID=A0AAD5LN73_PYTIN|nr:hypothetical protein P43SY_006321 [Pythium insidiosum]
MTTPRVKIRLGHQRASVSSSPATPLDIHIHDSQSDRPAIAAATVSRVCRVCVRNEARYACPRCSIAYCSVECFRAHGESCTEQFYQEHVKNEIAFNERTTARDDHKKNLQRDTVELLGRVKQFHEELHDQTAEMSTLDVTTQRLEQLAMMDEAELSLDCLTEDERARFLADVADGKVSSFVVPWEPWWLLSPRVYDNETSARRGALIRVLSTDTCCDSDDEGSEDDSQALPPRIEPARFAVAILTRTEEQKLQASPLSAAVRGNVSPWLEFHLVEILFAYALTLRMFNGEWQQDSLDAAAMMLQSSDVLSEDARLSSLESVVQRCSEKRSLGGLQQLATNALVLSDVASLLSHRPFVLDALTDAIQMMRTAISEMTQQTKKRKSREARRRLASVEKKLEFFRVWFACVVDAETALLMGAKLSEKLGSDNANE